MPDIDEPGPWLTLRPGDRMRFATDTFVRRGHLVERAKRSAVILFDGHDRTTVLPDGFNYWVQPWSQTPHLARIHGRITAFDLRQLLADADKRREILTIPSARPTLTFQQALGVVGVDGKTLRRYLRSGKIQGVHRDGRWISIDAESARAARR